MILRFLTIGADHFSGGGSAKSEKIDPAQHELELEDIETAIAQVEAEIDADERTAPVRPPKQRHTNRGSLPKHLERVEVVIEPELSCGCGAERHVIGEDVSERLDIIPAQFRVIVTRRPKYAIKNYSQCALCSIL